MPTQDRKALKQYFRNILLFAGVLVLCLGCFYYVQAWTDAPAGTPPTCPAGYAGCDAPINVGSVAQYKTGDLGIGTTGLPERKLHVSGGNILLDNAKTLEAKNSAGTVETWMWPRWSDNVMYTNYGSAGWNIRNNASTPVMFMTNGGNVGIGTTGPMARLDVRQASDAYDKGLVVTNAGNTRGLYIWQSGDTARLDVGSSGNYNLAINGAGTGNVGIGTTAPSNKLSVNGNADFGATSYAYAGPAQYGALTFPRGQILWSNTNTQNQLYIMSNAYNNASGVFAYRNAAPMAGFNFDVGNIYFMTDPSGTIDTAIPMTTRMIILNSGNVGIGTTAPGAKLAVNGAMLFDYGNALKFYRNVYQYTNDTATLTGTMKIVMPKTWSNTMVTVKIIGYDYSGVGEWELTVSGYNYATTPAWYNYSAELSGSAPFNQVRLAHDGTNNVILLGTIATAWHYPKMVVSEVMTGYSSYSGWDTGWSASIISSETGIAYAVTPTLAIYVNSSANVGINTTDPSSFKLQVAGGVGPNTSASYDIGSSGLKWKDAYFSGTVTAGAFSGPVSGAISAPNVSAGAFGANTGGGNYSFPGNVGIGTTNPTTKLDIVDTGGSPSGTPTFPMRVVSGSGTNPGFIFERTDASQFVNLWTGSSGAVLGFSSGLNRLVIGSYSYANRYSTDFPTTEVMSLLPTGNVGIGTTNPSSFKLQVAGSVGPNTSASYDIGSSALKWKDAYFSGTVTAGAFSGPVSGAISAPNVSAGSFGANTGGGNYSFPGNVGIGTTNPSYKLVVSNGGATGLEIDPTGVVYAGGVGIMAYDRVGAVYKDISFFSGAAVNANFTFKTTGNVGIGTTDPSSFKLQVAGNVGPNTSASYDIGSSALKWKDAYFSGTVTAGAFSGPVSGAISAPNVSAGAFGANTGGGNYSFPGSVGIGTASPSTLLSLGGSLGMKLAVYDGGTAATSYGFGIQSGRMFAQNSAGSEVMVWTGGGNVGIGTTDPGTYKLYVNGPVRIPAKLTVNTIDPIYKIGGVNYATYVSDFAGGVRTETSGLVSLENISANQRTEQKESASTIIDFENSPTGSDIWLFWQTSNENIADLVALLTPSFDGKVWYEKQGNKLMIYGSQAGEVSYRLTLPREDDQKWGNITTDE